MSLLQRGGKLFQAGGKLTDDPNCCLCGAAQCVLLEGIPEGNDSAQFCLDDICGCADFLQPYKPVESDPRCSMGDWQITSVWFAHDSAPEHNVWPWPEDNTIGDAVPYIYAETCCPFCDLDVFIEALSDWYRACVPSPFAQDFIPMNTSPWDLDFYPNGCPICLREARLATIDNAIVPFISIVCDIEPLDCYWPSL